MNWDESYKILQSEDFEKAVRKNLPPELKKVLNRKIEYLAQNPNHPSLNTKTLRVSQQTLKRLDVDEVWEFRINMSFRCVFYIKHLDKCLILALAGNHEIISRKFSM